MKPYDPGRPCEIQIDFTTSTGSSSTATAAASRSAGELTLVSAADDWWTAWSQFYF